MDRLNQLASSSTSPTKSAKLAPGTVKFIAPPGTRTVKPLKLTKAHFADAYSKGKWNLSNVPCPACFSKPGLFAVPEYYDEISRCKIVRQYKDLPHWKETFLFKKILSRLRKEFSVNGVSISVVDETRTTVKFEHLLDLTDIPRAVAIDSHTILSQAYFLLLDASQDWRVQQNPFVCGVPHIKFYLGVPLTTKDGTVIGAVAVFDSFVQKNMPVEKIRVLQSYAREVMRILESPIEKIQRANRQRLNAARNKNCDQDSYEDGIKLLTKKIGRATSKGEQMTNIFEKDGSGGPYTQNHTFRFTRINEAEDRLSGVLFERLINSGNLKNGATQLSKFLVTKYGFDFAYVLEIKVGELFQIKREYFPSKEKKVDAERFKHANKLVKDADSNKHEYITRIIGFHGCTYNNLQFENEIHHTAFTSEFGIHYQSARQTSLYNDGIIMPFFRHNSKFVRRHKPKKTTDADGSIEVYLRTGGFLVACFNETIKADAFTAVTVSHIFEHSGALRKLYISG
ncbi:GAF domain-containing protein [[Candida] zeylanoides]